MKFIKTKIPGVILIEPTVHGDSRGFFVESYKKSVFAANGIPDEFVQDNHSKSGKGVLRGLHYQVKPAPMGKLVRAIRGEIFDVAVDVRKGSKTFGQWVAEVLSEENKKIVYLPSGVAHGFYTLSDVTEVVYKCTGEYSPKDERALIWNDPEIAIKWPLIEGKPPILSERDKKHPGLKDIEAYV